MDVNVEGVEVGGRVFVFNKYVHVESGYEEKKTRSNLERVFAFRTGMKLLR